MRNLFAYRVWAVVAVASVAGAADDQGRREQIGEVLGKPVYRDQIRTGDGLPLADELGRLFLAPVSEKYRQDHEADITPTSAEIDAVAAYFDKLHKQRIKDEEPKLRKQLQAVQEQLKKPGLTEEQRLELETEEFVVNSDLEPPGRNFAEFVLNSWKFQKHLYDNFGGGRILWQQAGTEAFDATHQWLLAQEQSGQFKITDPELRKTALHYWTTQQHGPFLESNPEEIRTQFLEPEWAKDLPKKDKTD